MVVSHLSSAARHAARTALVGGTSKAKLCVRAAAAHVTQSLLLLFAIQIGATVRMHLLINLFKQIIQTINLHLQLRLLGQIFL